MTSVASTYLWLLQPSLALVIAFFIYKASMNAFRAVFLWRNKDIKVDDPILAEAMRDAVPPQYTMFALIWAALAVVGIVCVYFAKESA